MLKQSQESIVRTMQKFGFVYSDVSHERAQNKANQYEQQGFSVDLVQRDTGFFVIIKQDLD